MKSLLFPLPALAALLLAPVAPAQTLVADGITEPVLDVTLSASVAGIVGNRLLEEGAFVRRDQTVIELDKRLEELEVARRELVKDLAETELERARKLAKLDSISISGEEMDKRLAEFNIALVELELAREHLRKRLVTSPLDGYITELFLDVGEACQIQQPVARIVDTRRCHFVANVDAIAGHTLEVGQPAQLEIEAGPGAVLFTGSISFVSPVVDPASGLMKVKVLFENPEGRIRPGVAGKALFALSEHVN